MNDVIREPEFERTIDLTSGANKVQNCRTYTDEVYRGDDNSKDRFEALMAQIEEEHSCAGVCFNGEEKANPIYIYSNINDG